VSLKDLDAGTSIENEKFEKKKTNAKNNQNNKAN
jgi:hypothetical protein